MSVAVADRTQGPYEFYDHVKHKDGTHYGNKTPVFPVFRERFD